MKKEELKENGIEPVIEKDYIIYKNLLANKLTEWEKDKTKTIGYKIENFIFPTLKLAKIIFPFKREATKLEFNRAHVIPEPYYLTKDFRLPNFFENGKVKMPQEAPRIKFVVDDVDSKYVIVDHPESNGEWAYFLFEKNEHYAHEYYRKRLMFLKNNFSRLNKSTISRYLQDILQIVDTTLFHHSKVITFVNKLPVDEKEYDKGYTNNLYHHDKAKYTKILGRKCYFVHSIARNKPEFTFVKTIIQRY